MEMDEKHKDFEDRKGIRVFRRSEGKEKEKKKKKKAAMFGARDRNPIG